MASGNEKKRENRQYMERTGKFFREVRAELKKVVWPRRAEVVTSTIVVILTVIVIGLIIGGFDLVFSYLIQLVTKG